MQPSSQVDAIPAPSMTIEQAIANLKQTEDPSARYYAAWWLGRFRVCENAAIAALIDALSDDRDRSPDGGYPLRRNAAKALGKLGDGRAVSPLIDSLSCHDYYVRESAAQALEELGDARAIRPLVKLLEGGVEAAVFVPGKPHLVQPYDSVLEALGTLHATDALSDIPPFLDHPVPRVQYAASRALYQLTGDTQYGDRLVRALRERDLQLRRAALMDLGAIGYLDAAQAISETHAENSLKLIALKGILEKKLDTDAPHLDDRAVEVMQYMDRLL
ncbi:HEAT repeat domain-containing protein [Geitlerinema sp. CS-897]|nr:HEAT repeat domain-containing protein [Geitlerinema sp. CS-897]